MARQVTINAVEVTEETQIVETNTLNDELKSKVITIKDTTDLEPYDVGLLVRVTEGSLVEFFRIANDTVVLTGRSPKTYTHTITAVESIKDLERITMPSLQYTQNIDTTTYTLLDIVDRALKIYAQDESSSKGANRVYDISGVGTRNAFDHYIVVNLTGLAKELYERKAPEMKFNTPTLKEIFDEVFLLLNGRPVMEDVVTIGIQYYNQDGDEIDLADVEEITGNQSIDKFAQKYDIYMENAISESNLNKQAVIYPSANSWASVRSSEVELTTNNFLMNLTENVERVLKFEILADVEVDYLDSVSAPQTFSGVIETDMTDYIYLDKRTWDSLPYEYDLNTGVDGSTVWNYPNHFNSVYVSGKEIVGWHNELDIFGSFGNTKNWHAFIATATFEGGYIPSDATQIQLSTLVKPEFNTSVRDFMFRLTYVPNQTVRLQIEKDKTGAQGTLFANQTDRIVDSEMLGQNLQNKLNREGNKELQFTKKVIDYTNAFHLGDYYGDYKVTKVNNDRQIQYTVSTATLSKDYAKRSERMTIANMPRQTKISAENTVRNDILTQYIELDTSSNTNNTYLTLVGINRYMDTFRQTNVYDNPVEVAQATLVRPTLSPCVSQGVGKVLNFKWGYDSNISAGASTSLLDTIYGNSYYIYTTVLGTATGNAFKLVGGFTPSPNTFAQKSIVAQQLPEYSSGDVTLNDTYVDVPTLNILKDSSEVYNFSYQLANVTSNENIYVGNKLATENALVVKDTEQLYLYSSSNEITFTERLDDGLTKQLMVTASPSDSSEVQYTSQGFSNYGLVQFTTNFNNLNWAIANDNREVYMIVNILSQDRVYFNPRNKRS